jgi:hypothetical protein
MKLAHFVRLSFAVLWLSLVVGCAGMQKPVSTEDYVQSARAQVGAVYQTIGDLKAQGSITQAQSKTAIAKTEKAEAQLDLAAAALTAGNQTSAQQIAGTALAVLLEIQSSLPKPKGK